MSQPITFQTYDSQADALTVRNLLEENGISVEVEKPALLLDNNILGVQHNPFLLKIAPGDFTRAREILLEHTQVDLDTVDSNYTLLHLNNEELLDVVAKPDEWGVYNYKLALALLEKRGRGVSEQELEALQQKHLDNLETKKKLDPVLVALGYVFSIVSLFAGFLSTRALLLLYSLSFLPGIFGVIIGWTVMRSKLTLPDGRQVISYDENSRRHAKYMFWIGLVALVVNIYLMVSGRTPAPETPGF
jgi:hypothetical protein